MKHKSVAVAVAWRRQPKERKNSSSNHHLTVVHLHLGVSIISGRRILQEQKKNKCVGHRRLLKMVKTACSISFLLQIYITVN